MKPVRILLVNSFFMPEVGGGAEMTLWRLATGLRDRGHDVGVFTTGEGLALDDVDGIKVYRFPIDNFFRKLSKDLPNKVARVAWQYRDIYSRKMAARLRRTIESFDPAIVQFHNLPGITRSVWKVPHEYGLPAVQVLHDLNLICPNSSMFRGGASCQTICRSCATFRQPYTEESSNVDYVVGVSEFVLKRVTQQGLFPRAQQRVIYNAQDIAGRGKALSLGAEPVFGFIGNLIPAKGLEWLIDQFDNSMGILRIAGEGSSSYERDLRAAAKGKHVEFIGRSSPAEFFPTIDVAIVPSIWNEALGNVAIEASAYGRCVIASRRGGLPEIVKDGVSGILVDPDEPASLGRAMALLANDREMAMRYGAAGPSTVEKFTRLDRFLDEYEAVYRELTGLWLAVAG